MKQKAFPATVPRALSFNIHKAVGSLSAA